MADHRKVFERIVDDTKVSTLKLKGGKVADLDQPIAMADGKPIKNGLLVNAVSQVHKLTTAVHPVVLKLKERVVVEAMATNKQGGIMKGQTVLKVNGKALTTENFQELDARGSGSIRLEQSSTIEVLAAVDIDVDVEFDIEKGTMIEVTPSMRDIAMDLEQQRIEEKQHQTKTHYTDKRRTCGGREKVKVQPRHIVMYEELDTGGKATIDKLFIERYLTVYEDKAVDAWNDQVWLENVEIDCIEDL